MDERETIGVCDEKIVSCRDGVLVTATNGVGIQQKDFHSCWR